MLRIFRHYIPVTLLLLGATETLILLVSIYLGAALALALGAEVNPDITTTELPLWTKALAFYVTILTGMIATGLYQREQREQPLATLLRLCLSFVVGFFVMGLLSLTFPLLMVGGATYAMALVSAFIGIATGRLTCRATTAPSGGCLWPMSCMNITPNRVARAFQRCFTATMPKRWGPFAQRASLISMSCACINPSWCSGMPTLTCIRLCSAPILATAW